MKNTYVLFSVKNFTYLAVFALGIPAGLYFAKEYPENLENSLSCFEADGTQEIQTLGEVGKEKVTLSSLPPDLRQRLTQMQMSHYRQTLSVLEEFAVRRSLSEQNISSQNLPALEQLQKQDISEQELQNFYRNNRSAFGSRAFDEIKPLLKKQIGERRTEVILKSKRDELHAQGYFRPYFSAPCGAVLRASLGNEIHYTGKDSARNVIELLTDYSVEARVLDSKITAAVRGHENQFKVLISPVAREGDFESEFLVRGFLCAKKQSAESAAKFHKDAHTVARNAGGNASAAKAGKALALAIAERAGLDLAHITACLDTQDVTKEILEQRKTMADQGISGGARVYLNKREVLMSNQLEIDDVIAQFAKRTENAAK